MSQKVVIVARRYDLNRAKERKALKQFRKSWPGKLHRVPCGECHLICFISQSSKDVLDERSAVGAGLETDVVCDQCKERAGLTGEEPEITTAGQEKERRELALKLDTRARRN
jgi:hypothetical protein